MSMETDILDMIISSHGISTADLKEAFEDEYTPKHISNTLTRLENKGLVERIDGLNFATKDATGPQPPVKIPAPEIRVKAKPAPCEDVGDETEYVGAEPEHIVAVPTTAKPATPMTQAEALARQIRAALGPHNDDDDPLVSCVMELVDRHADLVHENQSLYALISKMRTAAGDNEGTLMQDGLVQHIKQLHQDAEEARAVRQYFAGFGEERPLLEIVNGLQVSSSQLDYQTALHLMQSLLGNTYEDDTFITITYDTATVTVFGRQFVLPSSCSDEIVRFMESVGWLNGQEVAKAA